jgi:hypothetical protein
MPGESDAQAFTYFLVCDLGSQVSPDPQRGAGVFVNTRDGNSLFVMLDEIGHALGLKHPFEGYVTPSQDLGATAMLAAQESLSSQLATARRTACRRSRVPRQAPAFPLISRPGSADSWRPHRGLRPIMDDRPDHG